MSVILPSLFNTHPRLTPCERDLTFLLGKASESGQRFLKEQPKGSEYQEKSSLFPFWWGHPKVSATVFASSANCIKNLFGLKFEIRIFEELLHTDKDFSHGGNGSAFEGFAPTEETFGVFSNNRLKRMAVMAAIYRLRRTFALPL